MRYTSLSRALAAYTLYIFIPRVGCLRFIYSVLASSLIFSLAYSVTHLLSRIFYPVYPIWRTLSRIFYLVSSVSHFAFFVSHFAFCISHLASNYTHTVGFTLYFAP